jgi:hypothetical protein
MTYICFILYNHLQNLSQCIYCWPSSDIPTMRAEPPFFTVGSSPLISRRGFRMRREGAGPGSAPRSRGAKRRGIRGGKSPPRSGVSILTAWFFARASRGKERTGHAPPSGASLWTHRLTFILLRRLCFVSAAFILLEKFYVFSILLVLFPSR